MSIKPWEGRFSEKTAEIVEAFTSSIHFDKRLYAYDITGSIAHCKMLSKCEIITEQDSSILIEGLGKIRTEIESGNFLFIDSLEDIHMHIESRLYELVGTVAQKLHTARSRNDQIALDLRMYLRDECKEVIKHLIQFRRTIVSLAKNNTDVIMPGYTHLQRAQPVLFSHHIMAYYEMFSRDTERFLDSFKRTNVLPLGSAALAGTTYPIDRHYTAELLGFPSVSSNSIDSVADRDFIIEFLSATSICMMHFSRLSEELIIWSSYEFSFVELSDDFTTGSSIMPQKKNPDVAELVRGKTGRVYGDLMALLSMMKSLPLAYNRDMQEDKISLFNSIDTLKSCIKIYDKMLSKIKIHKEAMYRAASKGFLNATDMADYMVNKGVPFREAHHCTGRAVRLAISQNKELHELSIKELQSCSSFISDDIFDFLTVEQLIHRRKSFGGTSGDNVRSAMAVAEENLDKELKSLNDNL